MAFPDLLVSTIEEYDIDGTKGCNPFPRRSNLLVDVSVRLMTEDHLQLSIKQTFPEGFGVQAYFHDFLTVPGDLQGDADLILIWDAQVALPPRFQKIWLWQVVPSEVDVCTFCYDDLSRWFFADNEGNLPQGLQHVEMFSGGVGGWSLNTLPMKSRCHPDPLGLKLIQPLPRPLQSITAQHMFVRNMICRKTFLIAILVTG